jgi:putative nucleotidyltransferase with HDIG domain
MLLGSRSLWLAVAGLAGAVVIAWARDVGLGPTPAPPSPQNGLVAGAAALTYILVIALLIDRVGAAMRRNYRATLEREEKLRSAQWQLVQRTREVESLYRRLEKSYEETMRSLTTALDMRDQETLGHSARVVGYAHLLGGQLGLGQTELQQLRWGAILHDIGKIAIPVSILRKKGPLDREELSTMHCHPALGHRMLRNVSFLDSALDVVRHHHERWDGDGYPRGLRGEEIPLVARIFAVVDAYDAMTSQRPYRPTLTPGEARRELRSGVGKHFDADIVEAFLAIPLRELKVVSSEAELSARDRVGFPFDEAMSIS